MPKVTTYFRPILGKPVRFLAIEWREPWEFDHPTVLLQPIVAYSPNGESCEDMILDTADDIAIREENNKPFTEGVHPSDQKEFEWRGWSLGDLWTKAEDVLLGKKVKLGTDYVGVHEALIVFELEPNGEIDYRVVEERRCGN